MTSLGTRREILGTEQTMELLESMVGCRHETYFEENEEDIQLFFEIRMLTPQEATFLYAPESAINPAMQFKYPDK